MAAKKPNGKMPMKGEGKMEQMKDKKMGVKEMKDEKKEYGKGKRGKC